MDSSGNIHKVQREILYALQHATRARYSELMRSAAPNGSDIFKFHLRTLMKRGFVFKSQDGAYELTAEGKSFVGRLDRESGRQIPQPKSSMLMVVLCNRPGVRRVLGHKRTREPFRDFWGIASTPVLRGVPLHEAAQRELYKQTGIVADFETRGLYRVIDKNQRGIVLEDKLFTIMVAKLSEEAALRSWSGGISEWMDVEELLKKPRLFPTTPILFDMLDKGDVFGESTYIYKDGEY